LGGKREKKGGGGRGGSEHAYDKMKEREREGARERREDVVGKRGEHAYDRKVSGTPFPSSPLLLPIGTHYYYHDHSPPVVASSLFDSSGSARI